MSYISDIRDQIEATSELRGKIINAFTPMWAINDGAHRVGHFTNVEMCGFYLNFKTGMRFDPKLITYVAYFHDLFAWDRDTHEIHSCNFVTNSQHEIFNALSPAERELVAIACLEHRASFKGDFTTSFSELMNAADLEIPSTAGKLVERAIEYRIGKGMSSHEARIPAIEHIKEKFGTGGYCRVPNIYNEVFKFELEIRRHAIDAL